MKFKLSMIALAISLVVTSAAFAGSDDKKWISQCIKDNATEGQSAEVVQKYCECMNSKMSENETQSITQWEKTHQTEEKECSKTAGWTGK